MVTLQQRTLKVAGLFDICLGPLQQHAEACACFTKLFQSSVMLILMRLSPAQNVDKLAYPYTSVFNACCDRCMQHGTSENDTEQQIDVYASEQLLTCEVQLDLL